MFKIIGADQKEYGPISVEQIRQWIRDGRLNEHTQARSEAGGDWQPLGSFPEFADIFAPAPGVATSPSHGSAPGQMSSSISTGTREAALAAVKGPAIALIVIGSLGVLVDLLNALVNFIGGAGMMQQDMSEVPERARHLAQLFQGTFGGIGALIGVAFNVLIIFGALKMLRLQSRSLALAACIVAMLPCSCCCVLGLAFGIWGLIVLNKPEVKSHFDVV